MPQEVAYHPQTRNRARTPPRPRLLRSVRHREYREEGEKLCLTLILTLTLTLTPTLIGGVHQLEMRR